jgi:hypothetical protein
MDNTQLPAEVIQRINDDSLKVYPYKEGYNTSTPGLTQLTDVNTKNRKVWREGATEYATKLHQSEQEIAQLKQWKSEASELLSPILDYGQSKEADIPLGKIITNTVLERCKQATALQAKCGRCEKALKELVRLKVLKDKHGKTEEYLKAQPLAWKSANEALCGEGDRICPNCNKIFNADRHGNCRECGSDEYKNQKEGK